MSGGRANHPMIDALICRLFALAWRKWLRPTDCGCSGTRHVCSYPWEVVRVKGWRTALVATRSGQRQTVTFCFRVLGLTFD